MGHTKRFTEPEIFKLQYGRSSNRHRRSDKSLGQYFGESSESPPVTASWRFFFLRLRRSFVALRFQANRWTLGLFRSWALPKLAFLAIALYFSLFFKNEKEATVPPRQIEQGVGISIDWGTGTGAPTSPKATKIKTKNDAAPVSASELLSEQSSDYVSRYKQIAIGEMKKYGIPASISLAQGLIESRAGTSKLAVRNNNHFGIKCFSRRCGKGHCSNFTDDTHKDFFRKFKSPWESWRAHSQLLASGRYLKLKKYGADYRKWAYGLKSIGYATDRTYAEKLIGIIERYQLYKYDR